MAATPGLRGCGAWKERCGATGGLPPPCGVCAARGYVAGLGQTAMDAGRWLQRRGPARLPLAALAALPQRAPACECPLPPIASPAPADCGRDRPAGAFCCPCEHAADLAGQPSRVHRRLLRTLQSPDGATDLSRNISGPQEAPALRPAHNSALHPPALPAPAQRGRHLQSARPWPRQLAQAPPASPSPAT